MATHTWTYAGTANWTTAADWSSGVPISTSDVVIAQGNPVVAGPITIASLTLSAQATFNGAGGSTISGALSNTGKLILDGASGQGGSNLTIGGALTNTGIVQLGASDGSLSAPDTLKAASLVNTGGRLLLYGGGVAQAATIAVAGSAGFGFAGVLSGSIALSGHAAITFASGTIATIASHSSLTLKGASAVIADPSVPTSHSALAGLTSILGSLDLVDGAQLATNGALINAGLLALDSDGGASSGLTINGTLTTQSYGSPSLSVDATQGEGGSTLTIKGALDYTGLVAIGNSALSQSSTVTATSLVALEGSTYPGSVATSYGSLDLSSDTTTAARTLLNVTGASGFGTTGVVNGDVILSGDSAIVFASGQISSIAASSALDLSGPLAVVADAGAPNSNSALSGLAAIAGQLTLGNGASVTTKGPLSLTGTVAVDFGYMSNVTGYFSADQGGSSLIIGGALTVAGSSTIGSTTISGGVLDIGNSYMTDNATVTAAALVNRGSIVVEGDTLAGVRGVLDIASAAGFGTTGFVSGSVTISSGGLIEFASGQIGGIASGATLTLDGPGAYIADAGALTSNSALKGLTAISGTFALDDGATFTTSGALTVSGVVDLDTGGYAGGSSLTITGVLTNGNLYVGSSSITASDTVKVAGLASTGAITLIGGASASSEALVNDTGAAGFGMAGVLSGTVNLSGASLIEFASGEISSIASGASLTLNGAQAFLADASSLTSNSALTGLTSNAGTLTLNSGASVATLGPLANTGTIELDNYVNGPGGSSVTVHGTFTNNGFESLGSSSITSMDRFTATNLTNTGSISLDGEAQLSGPLVNSGSGAITAYNSGNIIAGPVSGTSSGGGAINIETGASLEFDSSVDSSQNVTFYNYGGNDSLILGTNAATAFAGSIDNFGPNDSIDLLGLGTGTTAGFAENSSNTGGTLTLTNGSHVSHIAFSGSYALNNFSLTSTTTDTMVHFV